MRNTIFKLLVLNSGYIIDKQTIKEIIDNMESKKRYTLKDYIEMIKDINQISKKKILYLVSMHLLFNIFICLCLGYSLVTITHLVIQVIGLNQVSTYISSISFLLTVISMTLTVVLTKIFLKQRNYTKDHISSLVFAFFLLAILFVVPKVYSRSISENYIKLNQNMFSISGDEIFQPIYIHGTQKLRVKFESSEMLIPNIVNLELNIIDPYLFDWYESSGIIYENTLSNLMDLYYFEHPRLNLYNLFRLESSNINVNKQIQMMSIGNSYGESTVEYPTSQKFISLSTDGINYTNYPNVKFETSINISEEEYNQYTLNIYKWEENENNILSGDNTFQGDIKQIICNNNKDKNCNILINGNNSKDINDIVLVLSKNINH